jgi:serine/threonine-protein kinase
VVAVGPPPVVAVGPPPAVAVATPAPPQRADTGSAGRIGGIVLGGAGVLGLGIGALFDIHAHRLAAQRDDAARAGDASGTASLNRDAHSAETTAFIVGGASLIALGGGIVLLVRSGKASEVSVAPQFAPGQIGFVMRVIR